MERTVSNVIPFGERVKDVTHWPIQWVTQWCRDNGWVYGFKINWGLSGEDRCVIERRTAPAPDRREQDDE